jgi:hypothetical protein
MVARIPEKQFITHEPEDDDAWVCQCGNMPHTDGFFPCDRNGNEVEPEHGMWTDLYVCARCDRIIQQNTLEIVGQKVEPE